MVPWYCAKWHKGKLNISNFSKSHFLVVLSSHNHWSMVGYIRLIWEWHLARMKPRGKRPLGRLRHRWEDNIRMSFKQIDVNMIHWIDTYFFKVHSNIVLPPMLGPSWRSLSYKFTCSDFERTPIFLNSGYMTCPSCRPSRHNHPDYIRWALIAYNISVIVLFSFSPDRRWKDQFM